MLSSRFALSSVATFKDLPSEALELLEGRLQLISVPRGDCVVCQGDAADSLYVVLSGRFAVEIDSQPCPIAEISRGATVGEIAFFAGGERTATVRAVRDSIVVRLTRSDFDAISQTSSAVLTAIAATLAERLAAETRRHTPPHVTPGIAPPRPRPRTIAIVGAAGRPAPHTFLSAFAEVAAERPGTCVLSSKNVTDAIAEPCTSDLDFTDALNALESRFDTIVFITDDELTPWSEKVIRQADEVLLVASNLEGIPAASVPLGTSEAFALSLHAPSSRRLAVLHRHRRDVAATRRWLEPRQPAMHHHIALDDADDMARLWRFIRGEALGFVACGGGAYCCAHIGVYRAFREAGICFDIVGGTSGGAAMAAAIAQDLDPLAIDTGIHRMFIEGQALGRYTLPRYGLLDHTHFDAHLKREYGDGDIEDLWKPYFAVSTDLSNCETEIHRSGTLWRAIRASAAIPGMLPPLYTDDGRMLVDGSVISNVPIATMHRLKHGPNVVVSFQAGGRQSYDVDYAALPGRRDLLWRALNPLARRTLPPAPSAATVLVRSLMADRDHFERHLSPDDWLLVPPTPAELGALDWRRHTEIMNTAYQHTRAAIERRVQSENPML